MRVVRLENVDMPSFHGVMSQDPWREYACPRAYFIGASGCLATAMSANCWSQAPPLFGLSNPVSVGVARTAALPRSGGKAASSATFVLCPAASSQSGTAGVLPRVFQEQPASALEERRTRRKITLCLRPPQAKYPSPAKSDRSAAKPVNGYLFSSTRFSGIAICISSKCN
jgi:hypothetical protein